MEEKDNKPTVSASLPEQEPVAAPPVADVPADVPVADEAAEAPASPEAPVNPSKRDGIKSRLGEKYADRNLDDDEELFGAIGDEMDDYDGRLKAYDADAKSLGALFDKIPRLAVFIQDLIDGDNIGVALVRRFGPDFKAAIDDPDRVQDFAEAINKYFENAENAKELSDQYESNMAQSLQNIEDFQNAEDLDDEQVNETMRFIYDIINDGVLGKITPDTISMAYKALNHDDDVARAENIGEVRGRNTKIKEQLRKPEQGDGMPSVGGTNGKVQRAPKSASNLFALAADAK